MNNQITETQIAKALRDAYLTATGGYKPNRTHVDLLGFIIEMKEGWINEAAKHMVEDWNGTQVWWDALICLGLEPAHTNNLANTAEAFQEGIAKRDLINAFTKIHFRFYTRNPFDTN